MDPSGHSWLSSIASFLGAMIGIIVGIAVLHALPTMAPILMGMISGAAAGAAGGLVSGLIMGGIKGALLGALIGAVGGAIFGGAGGYLSPKIGEAATFAILSGAGLGLSVAAEGWQGIGTFAAGLLGAYLGGQVMNVNIFSCFAKKPYVSQTGGSQFKLDLGFEANFDTNWVPPENHVITAQRTWVTEQSTVSRYSIDGIQKGYFLEPSASGRILAGTYSLGAHDTVKFPLNSSLELQNVSGHSGILIHVGNYPSDTSGCLLPGLTRATDFVGSSQSAFNIILNTFSSASSMQIVIYDWHPPMAVNPPNY